MLTANVAETRLYSFSEGYYIYSIYIYGLAIFRKVAQVLFVI